MTVCPLIVPSAISDPCVFSTGILLVFGEVMHNELSLLTKCECMCVYVCFPQAGMCVHECIVVLM